MRNKSLIIMAAALVGAALAVAPGQHPLAAANPAPGAGGFLLYHADFGAGVWRMEDTGAGQTQLADHGWFAEYSPDNTRIAFGDAYNAGIWVMYADGSGQTQLTQTGGGPSWSPDGSQIAYFVGDATGASRRIWVMNANGSNPRQISNTPGSFPKWSPDGTRIAFHGESNNGIWLINPDGADEVRLYDLGGYPTWSPDGSQIAYVSLIDWSIWTMNADATGRAKLTEFKGIDPDWRPDGTQIAYEDLTNQRGIRVVDTNGANDHLVNQIGHAPDWSSAGAPPGKPDLIIESISGPASACVGEAMDDRIVLRIKNIGAGDAVATGGYFHTDLVLSPDVVIGDRDDILLIGGRDQVDDVLAAGQSLQVTLAGSNAVPATTAAGRYYLGAIVDAVSSRVDESVETNNTGFYYPIDIRACVADVDFSLHVEDALEGVTVNKVIGDSAAPAGATQLDIVARLFNVDFSVKDSLSVILTIPNDLFGRPTGAFVRDATGGAESPVRYTSLGDGRYLVLPSLTQDCSRPICRYHRQIVWRFQIPARAAAQTVAIQAEVTTPGKTIPNPLHTGVIKILKPGSVQALIVANRSLLYDHYNAGEVNSLLQRLFSEAAGPPASHSPVGVIYYVDRYSAQAAGWDNGAVNYTSSATANQTAEAIDDLIEDWHDDATAYVSIYIPLVGTIKLPIAWPDFLLVVGDDDTIPFYRYDDPSNDEGIDPIMWPLCPHGWCVTSATNPAIHATDEDYFFTDNPYADVGGGTDWQTGDVALWMGRLLGASAADMLSLLEEGVDWSNGQRGGAVMASVDGWELGLEPDLGGAGHIADVYDAPALLRGKGFAVRNDDNPASEVRTIDVMSPYEGGDASWNTNFRNAANDTDGMDIFFIGGHDSYDHADIPDDDFSPDDTCAAATCRYNRFDDDHPVALIVGCHGGLPVPDIDVAGGADHDMVYDLIHEGTRAYIGATGFSYGSPENLNKCTWGERLIQHFFNRLVIPSGSNSMAIGKAMAEAKNDYVFGFGSNDALDRKTVTEFNLYGVPWSFLFYPSTESTALAAPQLQAWSTVSGPVRHAVEAGVYSRTFEVTIPSYEVATESQGGVDYDLFSIVGGDVAIADGAPILPYLQGFSLTLPFSGTVTAVEVMDVTSASIGAYNVPIARVQPWSEGGLSYTTETDITAPYPTELVQYQQTGASVLFTLFPIQHNPTSDQTTFYSRFVVKVVYTTPLAVAITELATDKEFYRPGEAIQTMATIANVGDIPAPLTARLEIQDEFGEVIGSQDSAPFIVPAGESYALPLTWTGALHGGAYQAIVTIWNEDDLVGGASASFAVAAGEIVDFTAPALVRPQMQTTFRLTYANYRAENVVATVKIAIYDRENTLVSELAPASFAIGAGSAATADITGSVAGIAGAVYTALAELTVDGEVYGTRSVKFTVPYVIYLPSLIRN